MSEIKVLRGHKLPVTCLVISSDDKYIFSAAKDCTIIKCESTLVIFSVRLSEARERQLEIEEVDYMCDKFSELFCVFRGR